MRGRIRVERDGAIGWIVFDQLERRNAITVEMWQAIPPAAVSGAPSGTEMPSMATTPQIR
jgi:enoyl-CoA hydratase/carnithine racemase